MVKYVTCGDIMFKIGNIVIKGNVVLVPMAGVCNSAFRKIIKRNGMPFWYMLKWLAIRDLFMIVRKQRICLL